MRRREVAMRPQIPSPAWLYANRTASAALLLLAAACDRAPQIQEMTKQVVAAGAGSSERAPMRAVIPTRPAAEEHTIVVDDERYMGDIARQLGVTVDELLAMNKLQEPGLQRGQVLRVQTTADLLNGWEARRTERRAAKLAKEQEKRAAKAKAEADARAAKLLARRLKKLKGKSAEAALVAAHARTAEVAATGPVDVTHKSPGGATVRTIRVGPPLAPR